MIRVVLTFSLLVLSSAFAAVAIADLPADLQGILQRFLDENPEAPGICAHVECPRLNLSWSGAVGVVIHGSTEPLTAAHTFRIASNTKTYTAAALLRLVKMGRLGLDDPLGRHIPADQQHTSDQDSLIPQFASRHP